MADHSSSHVLRLDQNAQFHPQGVLSKACDTCAAEYADTMEQEDPAFRESAARNSVAPRAATPQSMQRQAVITANANDARTSISKSVVGSVPQDWAWRWVLFNSIRLPSAHFDYRAHPLRGHMNFRLAGEEAST